jgi:hypothetical protein
MIYSEADNRRETYIRNGWSFADDDVPKWPEPDPLSSAQSRRYWRACEPAGQVHMPAD